MRWLFSGTASFITQLDTAPTKPETDGWRQTTLVATHHRTQTLLAARPDTVGRAGTPENTLVSGDSPLGILGHLDGVSLKIQNIGHDYYFLTICF